MVNSVHTNISAQIALQGLNRTNQILDQVTKRVNTGFKVADAFDDGAAFAVAQGLRKDIKGLEAVREQLSNAKGLMSVANSAATSVSDAMGRMQTVIIKLADENVSGDTRTQYESQFTNIKTEIESYIGNAAFNGQNILSSTAGVSVISNISADQLQISGFDLSADVVSNLGSAPTTAAAAKTLMTGGFRTANTNIGTAMASYGANNTQLDNQISYLSSVSDATEVGLGAIVDADMAKESAKLQSLQIRQQLATQTLGIANQAPSILLSLFKG